MYTVSKLSSCMQRSLSFSKLQTTSNETSIIRRNISLSSADYERHKCKLLIVGGGAGGCSEAAKFCSKLGPNQVIVLEPSDKHYYQPMFTMIGGGMKTLNNSWKPMKDCIIGLAKWIQDKAIEFNPKKNLVVTLNCDEIEYEYMIVAAGLQLNYSNIPGLVEALNEPNGPVCSNYSPKYVERTFTAFKAFKSGNAIFTFPNSPVKCPGAPQKIMYIFEHYTRKNSKRKQANIMYQTALPVLFGVKHYADVLWEVCAKRDIQVNTRTNLIRVYPEKRQALFENLDNPEKRQLLDYDFLHVTPPMSAPDSIKNCKDLVNEAGFVDVNKETLQHVRYPNIFAIGDCSSSPNSKTAASVAAQSQVVYTNLSAVMDGNAVFRTYNGYASCPLVTGYNSCILAEFDYSLTPLETFPVPQNRERVSMFYLKKDIMPPLYWFFLLNGMWNGPDLLRSSLSLFKSTINEKKSKM